MTTPPPRPPRLAPARAARAACALAALLVGAAGAAGDASAALPPKASAARLLDAYGRAAREREAAPDVVEWKVLSVRQTLRGAPGATPAPARAPKPGARPAPVAKRERYVTDVVVTGRVVRVHRSASKAVKRGATLTLRFAHEVDDRPGPGVYSDPPPEKGAAGWAYLSCKGRRCSKAGAWGAFRSPEAFAQGRERARQEAERLGVEPSPARSPRPVPAAPADDEAADPPAPPRDEAADPPAPPAPAPAEAPPEPSPDAP